MFIEITGAKAHTRPPTTSALPSFGEFLQPDPLGYEDSPNLYAYVLDDPVNLIDPLGLSFGTCSPGEQWGTPTGSHIAQCVNPSLGTVGGLSPNWVGIPAATRGGGGAFSGSYGCVRSCNNPLSGDSENEITVYAPPVYGWISGGFSGEFAQNAYNPYGPYSGHGAFLHWYADQLVGGAEQERERAQEFKDQCLSGENEIDLGRVAEGAALQSGRSMGLRYSWDRIVIGALAGWRTYVRRAATGAVWGATKSFVRQSCGL